LLIASYAREARRSEAAAADFVPEDAAVKEKVKNRTHVTRACRL